MRKVSWLVIGLAGWLPGCAQLGFNPPAKPAPDAAIASAPLAAPPPVAAPPPAETKVAPPVVAALPPARNPPRPRPAPEPPIGQLDPEILLGMEPGQAELVVGKAAQIRQEPPATIWAYPAGDCTLELFFYPEVQTRRTVLLAYNVKGIDATANGKQTCFARVRAARRDQRG